jgi:small subunit ribosomal protein S2
MSNKVEVKELLEAGVHFGHMTQKMGSKYGSLHLYGNGIHIINLYKTAAKLLMKL